MAVLLLVYWLAFVWVAIGAGHDPGFVMHPEAIPYPVVGVVVLCVVLAMLVALLGLVLRPPTTWRRWPRIALRTSYVFLLMVLMLPAGVTDLPGITYVPARFSMATLLVLSVWALYRVAAALMARRALRHRELPRQ